MNILKKPTGKTITDGAITTVAFVAGAKIGDGVASLVPASMDSYKKIGLGILGIVAGASISGTTTTAKATQSALFGMAAKQLYDEVTDQLTTAVAVKDNSTTTNKFVNAVIGHTVTPVAALAAAWDNSGSWDRPTLMPEYNQGVAFNPDLLV
jgi:hypothetical protein